MWKPITMMMMMMKLTEAWVFIFALRRVLEELPGGLPARPSATNT
jgi:hypothetical protein